MRTIEEIIGEIRNCWSNTSVLMENLDNLLMELKEKLAKQKRVNR